MEKESTTKKRRPTIKDMITIPLYYNPVVSPDGGKVAYTKILLNLSTNMPMAEFYVFDKDSRETHYVFPDGADAIWLDNTTLAVNRHAPSGNPRWSDIYILRNMIGGGVRVLGHHAQLRNCSSYSKGFIFLSDRQIDSSRIGNLIHVENEPPSTALYYVSTERVARREEVVRSCFKEEECHCPLTQFEVSCALDPRYQVNSVVVSSTTGSVYLNCQPGAGLIYERDTVCFKVEIDPELVLEEADNTSIEHALSLLSFQELALPRGFTVKAVSPDGSMLLLVGPVPGASAQPRDDLWLVSDSDACETKRPENAFTNLRLISEKLDRYPLDVHWTGNGIYLTHWQESKCVITRLSETGDFETYDLGSVSPRFRFSINDNGDVAFSGLSPTSMQEVYVGSLDDGRVSLERITRTSEDYADLDLGTVESVRWKSRDGIEIEGILRKPSNFDPSKKYPLVLYPHGGPRVSSCLSLVTTEYAHPVHSLVPRGVLVLEPNYRGSLGRGREFMNLNHNNLGVGDLWDLESGIDHLVDQGFVDATRIGSMGGSQGGYLSAQIGMHTDRCAAVSVFAGVSSWYMYYIGSDSRHTIHLDGTPFDPQARESYRKSAPIAAISTAKTPMLLHHGQNDERITVVSAQELYRALKGKGVNTELFVLPGKGHGFLNPRENYAISLHTYRWFCHYLLGEELDLLKDDL